MKTIFVFDDACRQGSHGDYAWSVYVPAQAGGYQKLGGTVSMGKYGPPYVGPVSEIGKRGIVDSGKHVVSVQYLDKGQVKITFLGKDQEAEKEDYPKYFARPPHWKVQATTLAELKKTLSARQEMPH